VTAVVTVRGARLLLDADVLFPIRICDFILTASTNGLFQRPIVSEHILAEAIRNVIADLPDLDEARVQRRFANVRVATDGHGIAIPRRFVDEVIVNEKDRHVVAAAIFHSVDFVVANGRRLRRKFISWAALNDQALVALSADELVSRLLDESVDDVAFVVRAMAARMNRPARSATDVLEALSQSLPALGRLHTN
jgi:hypothetical protein